MHIPIETVRTETFTMNFFRFGRGSRTLVILPGLSVQNVMPAADAVAEAYRALEDDFTIYLFDRRSNLPPVYTVRDMARDTAAAFRTLGRISACTCTSATATPLSIPPRITGSGSCAS